MPGRLEDTTVLIVDCQATRANPRSGHLLELGWAVAGPDAGPAAVESLLVRLPPGAVVPEPVRRITGIADDEWKRSVSESIAWRGRGAGAVPYRVLVLTRGRVREAREQTATEPPPTPPGAARPRLRRQGIIDLAVYDRLRVLTTVLRRLVAEHRGVRVRCGPRRVLNEAGLRALLRWV